MQRPAQYHLAVDYTRVGVGTQATHVTLVDYYGAAIVHAHVDVIAVTGHAVLDGVATSCACRCAGNGGDVLVALAAAGLVGDFASHHRADDSAQYRARGRRRRAARSHGVDMGDDAAVNATCRLRIGRRLLVAVVAGRGGGTTGQGDSSHGTQGEQACFHEVLLEPMAALQLGLGTQAVFRLCGFNPVRRKINRASTAACFAASRQLQFSP